MELELLYVQTVETLTTYDVSVTSLVGASHWAAVERMQEVSSLEARTAVEGKVGGHQGGMEQHLEAYREVEDPAEETQRRVAWESREEHLVVVTFPSVEGRVVALHGNQAA